jgi:hypothetical protein
VSSKLFPIYPIALELSVWFKSSSTRSVPSRDLIDKGEDGGSFCLISSSCGVAEDCGSLGELSVMFSIEC